MYKLVLKYGLIAGGILSAVILATMPFEQQMGSNLAMFVGYTSMVLAFLMVFFGVRACREQAGGHIGFGRALLAGLLIALLGSVCYVITWEIFSYFAYPDFAEQYAASTLEHAKQSGAGAEQLAALKQQMDAFIVMYHKRWYNMAMTLVEPLPVGVVFALVTAGVLGRRRPAPQTAAA